MNAHQFKTTVMDPAGDKSAWEILTRELSYYFFSHVHDCQLEMLTLADVVYHFFDFFTYFTNNYIGTDLSRAYASFYVPSHTSLLSSPLFLPIPPIPLFLSFPLFPKNTRRVLRKRSTES